MIIKKEKKRLKSMTSQCHKKKKKKLYRYKFLDVIYIIYVLQLLLQFATIFKTKKPQFSHEVAYYIHLYYNAKEGAIDMSSQI